MRNSTGELGKISLSIEHFRHPKKASRKNDQASTGEGGKMGRCDVMVGWEGAIGRLNKLQTRCSTTSGLPTEQSSFLIRPDTKLPRVCLAPPPSMMRNTLCMNALPISRETRRHSKTSFSLLGSALGGGGRLLDEMTGADDNPDTAPSGFAMCRLT